MSIYIHEENKTFHLYHLKGTHPLRDYNKEFEHCPDGVDFDESAFGCINLIEKYTSTLKDNGIYDNTTILVLADHGESLYRNEEDRFINSPMVLYKGKNERGEISVDDTACSFSCLNNLYEEILSKGCSNNDASNALALDDRYTYDIIWAGHPTVAHSSVGGFEKVRVNGPVYDYESYTSTGERYLLDESRNN